MQLAFINQTGFMGHFGGILQSDKTFDNYFDKMFCDQIKWALINQRLFRVSAYCLNKLKLGNANKIAP